MPMSEHILLFSFIKSILFYIFGKNILRKIIHYKHGCLQTLKEKENDIKVKIKNLCEEEEFKIFRK